MVDFWNALMHCEVCDQSAGRWRSQWANEDSGFLLSLTPLSSSRSPAELPNHCVWKPVCITNLILYSLFVLISLSLSICLTLNSIHFNSLSLSLSQVNDTLNVRPRIFIGRISIAFPHAPPTHLFKTHWMRRSEGRDLWTYHPMGFQKEARR